MSDEMGYTTRWERMEAGLCRIEGRLDQLHSMIYSMAIGTDSDPNIVEQHKRYAKALGWIANANPSEATWATIQQLAKDALTGTDDDTFKD